LTFWLKNIKNIVYIGGLKKIKEKIKFAIFDKLIGIRKLEIEKPRKLSKKETEFLADYFHNEAEKPDIDGYVGQYFLPREVMEIYIKKYLKERDWGEEDLIRLQEHIIENKKIECGNN